MAVTQPRRGTVWWNDSHGGLENLDHKQVASTHQPYTVATTGWIVRDDDVGVSLVHSWNPEQQDALFNKWDYREPHFFPRGMIEKVEYLDAAQEGQ